jgi:hypothetical protein
MSSATGLPKTAASAQKTLRMPGTFAAASATAPHPEPPTTTSISPPTFDAAVTTLRVAAHHPRRMRIEFIVSTCVRSGPDGTQCHRTHDNQDLGDTAHTPQSAQPDSPALSVMLSCSATISVEAKRALCMYTSQNQRAPTDETANTTKCTISARSGLGDAAGTYNGDATQKRENDSLRGGGRGAEQAGLQPESLS